MAYDGIITALEIRRRNLAKAMLVKANGLDSGDERLRQSVATEFIEWELGRATQKAEVTGKDGGKLEIETSYSDGEAARTIAALYEALRQGSDTKDTD